jgi:hypothetical protein
MLNNGLKEKGGLWIEFAINLIILYFKARRDYEMLVTTVMINC